MLWILWIIAVYSSPLCRQAVRYCQPLISPRPFQRSHAIHRFQRENEVTALHFRLYASRTSDEHYTDYDPLFKQSNGRKDVLSLGFYNLRDHGSSRFKPENMENNVPVLKSLAHIISRFDVVSLQEFVGNDYAVVEKTLQMVNDYERESKRGVWEWMRGFMGPRDSSIYEALCSDPMGPEKSKRERLCFFYRSDLIRPLASLQVAKNGDFVRSPFVVVFEDKSSGAQFLLMNVHLTPMARKTAHELDHIAVTYDHLVSTWNAFANSNTLTLEEFCRTNQWKLEWLEDATVKELSFAAIVGDTNGDRPYVANKERENIQLFFDKYFWPMLNAAPSTVYSNRRYMQVIVHAKYKQDIIHYGVYRFIRDKNHFPKGRKETCEKTLANRVSNHYPGGCIVDMNDW